MKTATVFRTSMTPIIRVLSVAALFAATASLAGCATDQSSYSGGASQPILGQVGSPTADDYASTLDTNTANVAPPPSQQVASGVQNLSISSFVDPAGLAMMGPGAMSQAASAQYYALQFGRVGAARTWSDNNVSGQISVGPYVKVNNRDCRDFTNVVNSGAKSFTKRGTACREADGTWTVGSAAASAAPVSAPAGAITSQPLPPAGNAG
jgi:surface antigen